MRCLPRSAQIYLGGVWLVGALILGRAIAQLWANPAGVPLDHLFAALGCAALYALSEYWRFEMPQAYSDHIEFSLATPIAIAVALVAGPAWTALIVGVGYGLSCAIPAVRRKPWYKLLFNAAQLVISYWVTSITYASLAEPGRPIFGSARTVLALALVPIVFYLLNAGLVTVVLALVQRASILRVWKDHFKDTFLIDLAMVPAGMMLATLWQTSPVAIVLVLLPILVLGRCFAIIQRMHTQTRASLVALSLTLDHRDRATYHHSANVARYARGIAERLQLPEPEISPIAEAARLHDIGKIGIRDSILLKTGPLTDEERLEMERHPEIGASLIESFAGGHEGVPLVRHHHERYDGQGYPDGLAGDAIPIGARIIFVADAFEAMCADRPYRAGMPPDVALGRIRAGAGTQFDGRVVEAFVAWYADIGGSAAPSRAETGPVPGSSPALA